MAGLRRLRTGWTAASAEALRGLAVELVPAHRGGTAPTLPVKTFPYRSK